MMATEEEEQVNAEYDEEQNKLSVNVIPWRIANPGQTCHYISVPGIDHYIVVDEETERRFNFIPPHRYPATGGDGLSTMFAEAQAFNAHITGVPIVYETEEDQAARENWKANLMAVLNGYENNSSTNAQ
jgi:hypothetical protein